MEIEIYQLLHDNWLLLLFLVIGLGYLVGNIRIAGTPVGPTIGVLLAGLLSAMAALVSLYVLATGAALGKYLIRLWHPAMVWVARKPVITRAR